MPLMSFTSKQTSSPSVETPDHVESSSVPIPSSDSTTTLTPTSTDEPQSLSQTFYPYPVPSLTALKDQRAYEHDRQRSKKASDLAKAKARKGQWSLLTYDAKRALSRPRSTTPSRSRRMDSESDSVDTQDSVPEVTTTTTTSTTRTNTGTGTGTVNVLAHVRTGAAGAGGDVPVTVQDAKSEVKLADLITSGSVRKTRARKVKDSDYELIPHVRSVIVLDDITTRDVSFDEPWEHIDHSDSDDSSESSSESSTNVSASNAKEKKTYAGVLSVGNANGNVNVNVIAK